jgi:pimeloyl-ACP methyl ester carboxylesterase
MELAMLATWMAAAAASLAVTAPGPQGALSGTWVDAGERAPVVLVIPGSGPTDRDGNSPLGVTAASYRLLADALAAKGVSTVRIDKRGMFASKAAVPDANQVTIGDYAADARSWVEAIRRRSGQPCAWLLGHSEGGLVALAAAQRAEDICGVILVATPGRPLAEMIRGQLKANPANAPVLDAALSAIAALERGERVDVATMHPALQRLFAPQLQPFLIDTFRQDPAKLSAGVTVPMLVVQGDRDLQVPAADARLLAAAQPRAIVAILPRMNHVLKTVESTDPQANFATYADPSRPVDPALVEAIAVFVRQGANQAR